jgi:hypothetical protein
MCIFFSIDVLMLIATSRLLRTAVTSRQYEREEIFRHRHAFEVVQRFYVSANAIYFLN